MRSYACTCDAHEPATLRTSIHVIIGNFCICIPRNFRILVYKMRKCCRHYRTVVRKKKNIMPTISHQNAIIGNWTRRPLGMQSCCICPSLVRAVSSPLALPSALLRMAMHGPAWNGAQHCGYKHLGTKPNSFQVTETSLQPTKYNLKCMLVLFKLQKSLSPHLLRVRSNCAGLCAFRAEQCSS